MTTLRFYASGTRTADQRAAEQLSRNLQLHRAPNEGGAEDLAAPVAKAERRRRRCVLMTGKAVRQAD